MRLQFFIAQRYLFASRTNNSKSYNVINIISAISTIGMAIGTAALVIIMSIYNGFDSLVESMMGNIEPDIRISPAKGKVFVPDESVYDWIYEQESVASMCTVLQEQVFISYDGHQSVATAKGVDSIYQEESPVKNHIRDGKYEFFRGDIPETIVGTGLASRMGINPRFLSPVKLYFPSRNRKVSIANPANSVEYINVWPSGIFSINSEIDNSYLILDIDKMRELLEYENEVSAVEIRMKENCPQKELKRVQSEIQRQLGEDWLVYDRHQQNESLYKMMSYEKASIFLILIFVILIISLNIYGCLSLLIIEKRDDIRTLRAMGAGKKLIRGIFLTNGFLISFYGMIAGLVTGMICCLIQEKFGIIPMPGNFVIQAYPVVLKSTDILLGVAAISLIGFVIAWATSRKSVSEI